MKFISHPEKLNPGQETRDEIQEARAKKREPGAQSKKFIFSSPYSRFYKYPAAEV